MAIINVDYLRKQLLALAKTEEECNEITLALAGLSGDLELLTSAEIAAKLEIPQRTVQWYAAMLRKRDYRLGVQTGRYWLYHPAGVELIKNYKKLVGTPTKRSKDGMATN